MSDMNIASLPRRVIRRKHRGAAGTRRTGLSWPRALLERAGRRRESHVVRAVMSLPVHGCDGLRQRMKSENLFLPIDEGIR
jgi:hypothetical protein